MTGTYPSFMATQDGRAILGRQPTLQDMLRSVAQGAPTSTGGYGGSPTGLGYPGGGQTVTTGTGDRAMGSPGSPYFNLTLGQQAGGGGAFAPAGPSIGGGGRGIALPPGTQTPSSPVPGQGVPTGAGGGVTAPGGALTVQQLLRQLMGTGGGGGGGTGGAGGTAPGGIGRGQTGAEMGQAFGAENAAVHPDIKNALSLASAVMSPMTGLPMALANTAFPGIGQFLGNLGFPTGSFNVPGPQLTPAQQQQIAATYQQSPALAQALLHSMRNMRATPTVTSMPGLAGPNFAAPGFSITRTGSTPLTDAQINAEIGAYAPSWGGPGTAAGGGAGNLGGGGGTNAGGLGGGVGNMGGGQNRSF